MTQPIQNERATVSDEIAKVLSKYSISFKDINKNNAEDKIINALVEALVKYGKSRSGINKISKLSVLLCRAIGMGDRYCDVMEKVSLIYDTGNLKIDPEIYQKENKLTFEEFEIIKQHTVIGRDLLASQKSPLLDMAAVIAVQHHEWYDGSGYPFGLKGENISLAARIVAVADTAVALSSTRKGREIMDFEQIVDHMQKRSGFHFDPEVVDRFIENKEEILRLLAQ